MSSETKVQWIGNYEQGLEKARSQEKPLLLDFFKNG
jgi:hypothetical protein